MSNLYNDTTKALLDAIDIKETLDSNNLNNIKRVHAGTYNEDTLGDLIFDVVYFLENLTEQLKENEDENN
jgi:NTP pyrophosphatase (non-canonical NTP hydrolase)